ncbi:chemotaxis protein CheY [Caloranaerobacter azorensis H53214]|uniref:Chemotaxis protein CheY n=1 Tax=Caloranaerobacter azorensis H53214 TaxID=1156417 RepID=A0A096BI71_9FIRM|nr:DNA-binding domain-containing protein [Caloranaerobacter azorensis]KGG80537.1 chemotaxis protein CheY [Caloranaerobacter azorensis H53214]
MKFYIIENDYDTIRAIENIIEDNKLGELIGYSIDADGALNEILLKRPDIVLMDLLMPDKNGIQIIKKIKSSNSSIKIIIISQETSKETVSRAYNAGIDFFISKPINTVEISKVVKNISENIKMEKILNKIKRIFDKLELSSQRYEKRDREVNIKIILSQLGILGEKGSEDIINICNYIIKNKLKPSEIRIRDICNSLSNSPRAMEQRVRRAINKALINIVNLGLEDNMNDTFIKYSNTLFDFEDVKAEMDLARGKNTMGGKIKVLKFIEGLLLYSEL